MLYLMVYYTQHDGGMKVFVPDLLWYRVMVKLQEKHSIDCIEFNQERNRAEQGYFSPQVTDALLHSLLCCFLIHTSTLCNTPTRPTYPNNSIVLTPYHPFSLRVPSSYYIPVVHLTTHIGVTTRRHIYCAYQS